MGTSLGLEGEPIAGLGFAIGGTKRLITKFQFDSELRGFDRDPIGEVKTR